LIDFNITNNTGGAYRLIDKARARVISASKHI